MSSKKILVVWTPDGNVYFKANKQSTLKAIKVAVEMVTNTHERYEREDVEFVTRSARGGMDKLYQALLGVTAIVEAEIN